MNGKPTFRRLEDTRNGLDRVGKSRHSRGNSDGQLSLYSEFCKPKVTDMLASLGMNIAFEKASGNYVYEKQHASDGPGYRAVLDLVGGFGACLFGHNHPELKSHLIYALNRNCPTFVQASSRAEAGKLARALNDLIPADGRYYCNFANSGTEAVEAVVKHAYKVRFDAIREMYEAIARQLNDFFQEYDKPDVNLVLPGDFTDLSKFRDSIDEHNLAQFEEFQNNPVVCALKGSFHGKTSSALKLTFNKTYRESFEGLSSVRTLFFEMSRPERVREIVEANQVRFLIPEVENDQVVLRSHAATRVIGLIMEIILGEGGVKPVPEESLRYLAEVHDELGIPYIVDEIQTGCGRTGVFAAYTETALAEIEPEYLIFGKALGGGIVKISAALIHERVYDPDFGLLHTSTFGEDELSCSVANKALQLLTRENGGLMEDVSEKGAYFKQQLQRLQSKYPSIVREIRGRGLMLGLQFTELVEHGNFFRYAGQKGFISLLVASYLLHYHNVRVMAPLSTLYKGNPGKKRESIIRIQPSALITKEEMDRVIDAFDEVFELIIRQDQYSLLIHLIGDEPTLPRSYDWMSKTDERSEKPEFDARVGFIVNLTRIDELYEYYLPSFKAHSVSRAKVTTWWNNLSRFLEPEVVHTAYIESGGFAVEANIIAVPYLAEHMVRLYARGRKKASKRTDALRLKELQDKIKDASIVARDLGDERIPTTMVGLGAFTSIVTDNGMVMNDYEIPVTTGNTYTTGLILEGIAEAARLKGIRLDESTAAVVGAAGNIGRTLSSLLALRVSRLYLIGRGGDGNETRLRAVRRECLHWIAAEISRQFAEQSSSEAVELVGIAERIYKHHVQPYLHGQQSPPAGLAPVVQAIMDGRPLPTDTGELLERAVLEAEAAGGDPCIKISAYEDLPECDVVTVATNSTNRRLLGPETVKKGAIVSCASVPSNLSSRFNGSTEACFAFDSGFARLPENGIVDCVGMPKDGLAFGCLSETLLLGFEGRNGSFAKGDLDPTQVLETLRMADDYGFELGQFQLGGKALNAHAVYNPIGV